MHIFVKIICLQIKVIFSGKWKSCTYLSRLFFGKSKSYLLTNKNHVHNCQKYFLKNQNQFPGKSRSCSCQNYFLQPWPALPPWPAGPNNPWHPILTTYYTYWYPILSTYYLLYLRLTTTTHKQTDTIYLLNTTPLQTPHTYYLLYSLLTSNHQPRKIPLTLPHNIPYFQKLSPLAKHSPSILYTTATFEFTGKS